MHPTYTNPVYPRNFPDPFALRFKGRYYAYGTGPAADGRFFPILSSPDLVHWTEHGGALEPLDLEGAEEYWAPEVAYAEGRFYMYYATGRNESPDHHLRLAVAEHPLGPWQDAGRNLTPHELFAIDAHPYRDPQDGQWYLFYACDVLEGPYAGTGIVVDRLADMATLAGEKRTVLRPYSAWHLFELQRPAKQGLDWYTIEGPFVLRHGGRYVCLYSGGRWENPNYGVGYALADHPLGPWQDDFNGPAPVVLRTVADRVVGPGHNSVVRGPDLQQEWVVYHGWDPACSARMLRIDRLRWEAGHPGCVGPTSEPRPAPRLPRLAAYFEDSAPGAEWETPAGWNHTAEGLTAAGAAQLRLREPLQDFVMETSVRPRGAGGVRIGDLRVGVEGGYLRIGNQQAALPAGFRHDAWHHLLITRAGGKLTAVLDEYPTVQLPAPASPAAVSLWAEKDFSVSHCTLAEPE